MPGRWLLYGVTGYTGGLIARLASEHGPPPILAGRDMTAVAARAEGLRLAYRVFTLDDPRALDRGLEGLAVVLHCAGPFSRTARPMAEACLRTGTHYLDITGEPLVFEALHAKDAEARAAGVMLLPGVGFDVVPSDCLAVHLKRRLPGATRLVLGFASAGRVSRGTAATIIENLHAGGLVRRGGVLTRVPAAWKTRTMDFGRGPRAAVTIPWGDVATAFHSTGIPEIEVYMAAPLGLRLGLLLSRRLAPLLRSRGLQSFFKSRVRAGAPGPSDAERARGRSRLFAEAADERGRTLASRLETPEGYTLTAQTALLIVGKVLSGELRAGFQTPALAYGPDLILEVEGTRREDLG